MLIASPADFKFLRAMPTLPGSVLGAGHVAAAPARGQDNDAAEVWKTVFPS